MKFNFFTMIILVSISSSGCFKSKKKHNQAGQPQAPINQISEQHKANFEKWTRSVVKSCDASEAFGLGDEGSALNETLDAALVLKTNNNSVVFTDQDQLAILTDYDTAFGESQSTVERTEEINGVLCD